MTQRSNERQYRSTRTAIKIGVVPRPGGCDGDKQFALLDPLGGLAVALDRLRAGADTGEPRWSGNTGAQAPGGNRSRVQTPSGRLYRAGETGESGSEHESCPIARAVHRIHFMGRARAAWQ